MRTPGADACRAPTPSQNGTFVMPNLLTRQAMSSFIVVERARVLLCSIEKNANTLQAHVAAAARGIRRDRASKSAQIDTTYLRVRYWRRNATRLFEIFRDPSWRRVVVVRDPIDRFISAYRSKCARCVYIPGRPTPKGDGCHHCHTVFGLRRDRNWSVAQVAERLSRRSDWANDHWKLQGHFCGGLFDSWKWYTHRIPFEHVGEHLAAVFRGRDVNNARLIEDLCHGRVAAGAGRRTTMANGVSQRTASERTLTRLRAHYARDYQLIDAMRAGHDAAGCDYPSAAS